MGIAVDYTILIYSGAIKWSILFHFKKFQEGKSLKKSAWRFVGLEAMQA